MKRYLILITFLLFLVKKVKNLFNYKRRLAISDLDSSPLCDAIETVTPGYKNANFSHIGIIIELDESIKTSYKHDNVRVLESNSK